MSLLFLCKKPRLFLSFCNLTGEFLFCWISDKSLIVTIYWAAVWWGHFLNLCYTRFTWIHLSPYSCCQVFSALNQCQARAYDKLWTDQTLFHYINVNSCYWMEAKYLLLVKVNYFLVIVTETWDVDCCFSFVQVHV